MRCPKCGFEEDKVIDSRAAGNGNVIRRRRMCLKCSHRFTTYEEIVKPKVRVIKTDGRHEELSRQKLINGIERACEKRPISAETIEKTVDSIIDAIENEYEREVPSNAIGQKVMERLEKLDDVAYVRFASVYRRFADVEIMADEIDALRERKRREKELENQMELPLQKV